MESSRPLNLLTHHKFAAAAHQSHALLHSIAFALFLSHRFSSLLRHTTAGPELLVFASELLLSFFWILNQGFRWRPVSRAVFPERLPPDADLPAVDVFVCTADPRKEPPLGVMNTVLSAMALDYPPGKLSVYLSDDGASPATLSAAREAWGFGRVWIPFCKEYGIGCRCPQAYFSGPESDGGDLRDGGFLEAREKIKEKYETLERNLLRAVEDTSAAYGQIRVPTVQVIRDDGANASEQSDMPLLVYVSREKKPSHPHHFKAGALNVLLRVSGLITNAPYILMLDCDMYSNDPTSARQAMCFHLDPNMSPSLAFVQFPQKFHNISENDIYCGELRHVFAAKWLGLDGMKGPMLSGTCFYMKREALYGVHLLALETFLAGKDIFQLKNSFGSSNEFIDSLRQGSRRHLIDNKDSQSLLQPAAEFLASCTYEEGTQWGQKIGFLYHSLVEDYFTGFHLHLKGWTSVFCNPSRPAFLGSATTNLNDTLVQGTRWSTGLVEVALSRFCPLIYGTWRMSLLRRMCYAQLAFYPLICVPLVCLAVIPQLCLLNGIPVYPKASSPWFLLFSVVCLSSLLGHIAEVELSGGSIQLWWNELRLWMMKAITSNAYGTLDVILKWFGVREASFLPTNKAQDEEQAKQYHMGIFDFRTSTTLLAPLVTSIILNMVALAGGFARVIITGSWEELLGQILLSFFILSVNYPVIEGMLMRKDKGRISPSVTLVSGLYCILILSVGSIALNMN